MNGCSRLLAAVLALSSLAACDGETSSVPEQRLPLPAVAWPRLSCASIVPARGECARQRDCGQLSRCVRETTTMPSDGVTPALSCAGPVGTLAERERCQHGDECESGLCALAGVCVEPCLEQADCQLGQVCDRLQVRLESGLAPVMACTRAAAYPGDVRMMRGVQTAELVPGQAHTLSIPATTGQALAFVRTDCAAAVTVLELRAVPGGELLFDRAALLERRPTLNPVSSAIRGPLATLLLPNNPALAPSSSGYHVLAQLDRPSRAEVVVAARSGEHAIVDLNVFYVGGGEFMVPGGFHPGDPSMSELFAALGKRLAELDLELGNVREYDVTGVLRDELSVLENEDVLDDAGNVVDVRVPAIGSLFELSAGVDDGGLNLFIVSDMGIYLGLSGGIPGALGVHGTFSSGVALALDVAQGKALTVLLHEMAHQLGLFHTTEADGSVTEPLADTARCDRETHDGNGNGLVEVQECGDAGADNLMFWAASGQKLTLQQRQVLQRSLILR